MQQAPLRIPREWVERRISQVAPNLSVDALRRLESVRESLAYQEPLRLQEDIAISFFPDRLEETAGRLNMSAFELSSAVIEDFRQGVGVFRPDSARPERPVEFRVVGTRWRVIVKSQRGKQSGKALGVAAVVQPLHVPTNHPLFPPNSVSSWTRPAG